MRTITDELREAAEELEREANPAYQMSGFINGAQLWNDTYSYRMARREFRDWVGQHDSGSDAQ